MRNSSWTRGPGWIRALLLFPVLLAIACSETGTGPAPIAVESVNAARATIGPDGGSIHTTDSRGASITLEVPANALQETVEIVVTPIANTAHLPIGGAFAGASLEPSGLRFLTAATLTLGFASAPTSPLVGFGWTGDSDAARHTLVVTGNTARLPIRHFSGAGAGESLPGNGAFTQTLTDEAQAEADAAVQDTPSVEEGLLALQRFWSDTVQPHLVEAGRDKSTDAGTWRALAELNAYAALVQTVPAWQDALGGTLTEGNALATAAIRFAIARANAECIAASDWHPAKRVVRWFEVAQLMSLDSADGSGLDANTVTTQLCVQIVIEQLKTPATIALGERVNLELKAGYRIGAAPEVRYDPGLRLLFNLSGSAQDPTVTSSTDATGALTLSLLLAAGSDGISYQLDAFFAPLYPFLRVVRSSRIPGRVALEVKARRPGDPDSALAPTLDLAPGQMATVRVAVVRGAKPLAGGSVSVTSAAGGTVSPAIGTTDAAGDLYVTYTAPAAAGSVADTVTALYVNGSETASGSVALADVSGCNPPPPATYCATAVDDSAHVFAQGMSPLVLTDGDLLLVAGYDNSHPGPPSGGPSSFGIWKNGTITRLPWQLPAQTDTQALVYRDLNSHGAAVGTHSDSNAAPCGTGQPFIYQSGTFSLLATRANNAEAWAINESGAVVGFDFPGGLTQSNCYKGRPNPAQWSGTTESILSATFGKAFDLNASGLATGVSIDFPVGNNFDSVTWTEPTMTIVGTVGTGQGGGQHIDDFGSVMWGGNPQQLFAGSGARVVLPGPYTPMTLGHGGHVLARPIGGSNLPSWIVFNTRDGTSTAIDNSLLDPSLGWDLSTFNNAANIDRHGRFVGTAALNGTTIGVIMTPKGQPLPQ